MESIKYPIIFADNKAEYKKYGKVKYLHTIDLLFDDKEVKNIVLAYKEQNTAIITKAVTSKKWIEK